MDRPLPLPSYHSLFTTQAGAEGVDVFVEDAYKEKSFNRGLDHITGFRTKQVSSHGWVVGEVGRLGYGRVGWDDMRWAGVNMVWYVFAAFKACRLHVPHR